MERRIDELGRVVIPNHIRKTLGLDFKTKVKFVLEGDRVIITKAFPTCIICDAAENLTEINGKYVCEECKALLK